MTKPLPPAPARLYKAVRPNLTSFRGGQVSWAVGEVTRHPITMPAAARHGSLADAYLSAADTATDCTGLSWPCRLLLVEPAGREQAWQPSPHGMPRKWAASAFRVVAEAPAHEVFGPQGEHVADLIARLVTLTPEQATALAAARAAAWDAARAAARDAARAAARDAARAAARDAAWDAARAAAWDAAWDAARAAAGLLVRDLISTEHYDELTRVVRTVLGPIHPDDPALS